jgi:hypothetical protein
MNQETKQVLTGKIMSVGCFGKPEIVFKTFFKMMEKYILGNLSSHILSKDSDKGEWDFTDYFSRFGDGISPHHQRFYRPEKTIPLDFEKMVGFVMVLDKSNPMLSVFLKRGNHPESNHKNRQWRMKTFGMYIKPQIN